MKTIALFYIRHAILIHYFVLCLIGFPMALACAELFHVNELLILAFTWPLSYPLNLLAIKHVGLLETLDKLKREYERD